MSEEMSLSREQAEQLITENRFKVSEVSSQNGISPVHLRRQLIQWFGDRIEFRRGRTGGVFWRPDVARTLD